MKDVTSRLYLKGFGSAVSFGMKSVATRATFHAVANSGKPVYPNERPASRR